MLHANAAKHFRLLKIMSQILQHATCYTILGFYNTLSLSRYATHISLASRSQTLTARLNLIRFWLISNSLCSEGSRQNRNDWTQMFPPHWMMGRVMYATVWREHVFWIMVAGLLQPSFFRSLLSCGHPSWVSVKYGFIHQNVYEVNIIQAWGQGPHQQLYYQEIWYKIFIFSSSRLFY